MAISMKKYVDIKSSTNTTRTATEKELIARIFTSSASLTEAVAECENLDDVSTLFGSSSAEYKLAKKYFNFVNKYARSPKKISFAKDTRAGAKSTLAATITPVLTTLQAITSGAFTLSATGMSDAQLTGVNLSAATSLDDVVLELNYKMAGFASTGWRDSAFSVVNGKIFFVFGDAGEITVSCNDTTLSQALGLDEASEPILTLGAAAQTITELFKAACDTSNNFATFAFLDSTTAQEDATLGSYIASTYPSEFVYVIPVTAANYATKQAAVAAIDGVSLELCGATEATGLYNFFMPMAIAATTDYNKVNGTVNYMYMQSDDMVVMVNDDTAAATYDSAKVNYYGQTQKSGQKLAFYQNGVLQGKYQDQNIFVNEIWLKDAMTTKYINYMLQASNWYANKSGQAIGQGLAMEVIERAKLNGTITTEKEISESDKVFIYNVTADENAWRQIYQEGFYIITFRTKETINNQETYKFNYILLYSKGDSIKKVEGLNILI